MKLEGLNIIIISPDRWGFIDVSKHHYAKVLSKKNQVYFIDPPNGGEDEKISDSLHVIRKYTRVKGINKIPSSLRKRMMRKEVNSLLKSMNGSVDVVWSFDSSRLYYLDLFKAKLSIAHLVDFRENHFLKELATSADYCFATSDSIIDNLKTHNKRSHKLQHGYAIPKELKSFDLPGENSTKGIYIGNLDIVFLDWNVVKVLCKEFSSIDFVFIGPISQPLLERMESTHLSNLHFVPKVPSSDVPGYLTSATFCFQIYDEKMFPEQLQNPHKIMQYLGSGKPIFASSTHEYRSSGLIAEYKDQADVVEKFRTFSEELVKHSSEESSKQRIDYALDHTYTKQVKRIEEFITSDGRD